MNVSRFLKIIQKLLVVGLLLATVIPSFGQKRVKLKDADVLRSGKKGEERFQRLIGNVVFIQNQTTIYCDSAHFYRKANSVEAFGHVRIVEGDSITITGSHLLYNGDAKTAKLRRNVIFTKLETARLFTDNLDYVRPTNLAYYFNGGKLVDSINVLTSKKGYYNANSNLASFKGNVKVTNPDYTMFADSLQYNTRTKDIFFVTRTTVVNKDSSTIVYEGGKYNTITKTSDLHEGVGESEDYIIEGDAYDLDAIRNVAKIRGNVVMTSKKENLIIYGQASDYFKEKGITKVYNNAFVAKVTEDNDTLFMSADTLVSIDSEDPQKKRILAYHHVKIYKRDLQGIADSLEYRAADSTIYFYNDPVLWTQGNQLTADSISMLIENNTISKMFLVDNAFVISQDTLLNFNQIKGREMTAELSGRKINRVIVQGNGESIYFALDEKDQAFMGMNKIICSNITIRFNNGKVKNLSFYVKPEARFIPPHELKKEDKTLKGFKWQEAKKPTREEVVKSEIKVRREINVKPEIKADPY
jgi:lipopolysaccharide export system protein LptA